MYLHRGAASQDVPRRRFSTGPDLARALSIGDLRQNALRRLPRVNSEYVEGGADDETTLEGNRRAFDSFVFQPRILRNVSSIDLSRAVLGFRSALPFAIAPTGFNGLLWPQGDIAMARAAARAGIPFTQSTVSNSSIADVAAAGPSAHWFQLYLYGEDEVWMKLLAQAHDSGCSAVLVTVDTPVLGNREWDRRNYQSDFTPSLSSRLDMLRHPTWVWRVLRNGLPNFPNLQQFVPGQNPTLYEVARWSLANQRPQTNWQTIARLRHAWPGKLLIKGVQNLEDVRMAIEAGLDGVILSNHGGRQLDRAIAPIRLVREARALAGPEFAILVDSGFRRGGEIVQAIALGADAVLLGRAMLYGLAAGGEAGVSRAIEILRTEISRVLALLGVTSMTELTPEVFGG
ncbi:MAG: alpha-hydroxy acid oxidase [Hyphomicrobiales bacterium]|nr:alpha-hydroxy acid oxidase [Hyphomicrobiales bacterium]